VGASSKQKEKVWINAKAMTKGLHINLEGICVIVTNVNDGPSFYTMHFG
jgi:hypothetical protein